MRYSYTPEGTCSSRIDFDLNSGIVTNVSFTDGCPGNLNVIPKLIDGWTADKIVSICLGNDCAGRGTSCADQLARAILEAEEQEKKQSA